MKQLASTLSTEGQVTPEIVFDAGNFDISLSGTWEGIVVIDKFVPGGNWEEITDYKWTDNSGKIGRTTGGIKWRMRFKTRISGSVKIILSQAPF